MERPLRVLAIARMNLELNRGTPIRVRNILERLAMDTRFNLAVASWGESASIPCARLALSNNHVGDVFRVLTYIRRHHIDLVIAHTFSSWYHIIAVRLFTSARVMLEMHGFPEEEALLYGDISLPGYYLKRVLAAVVFKCCHYITACSETAADSIRRFNPRTIPVYGGFDRNLFNPDVRPEAHAAGTIKIGYIGNGRVWQGVPFLVETFHKYFGNDPAYELVLLLSERKGLALPSGIQVHPPVSHSEAPSFLASCDILVVPRPANEVNRLSFPSKLIEYMAMGKPVVASRTSDAHRVITDGTDGLLYDPGDEEGLANAIRALKDPSVRERIGAAAAETVSRSFTWERQVSIIADFINPGFVSSGLPVTDEIAILPPCPKKTGSRILSR